MTRASYRPPPLQSIVIAGGGTAGWVAAACLAKVLQNVACEITLVESPNTPTIGVGEATIPSLVDFIGFLGISELDFMRKTRATFKLGIKFVDWLEQGHQYWHPFGVIGSKLDGKPFYQHWLKCKLQGCDSRFTDFSPATVMAAMDKFFIPDPKQPGNLSGSTHAWHFDAGLVAEYLAGYAVERGVKRIRRHIQQVYLGDSGAISALALDSGLEIHADFFIDCSGQSAVLIGEALGVGYTNWQNFLPVDNAITVQTAPTVALSPYTEATAHGHGWRWKIPLQNRVGNGYVYCSEFCSRGEAEALLLRHVEGALVNQPRSIGFVTGKRDRIWYKNCLSLGLASGFLEPLESTSIYLIMRGMLNFIQMLPSAHCEQVTINEYNRLMDIEFQCIRDFIVLHYCTTRRRDSKFWQLWGSMDIPLSLKYKLELFKSHGRLMRNDLDLFAPDSWYAVLEGMEVRPGSYDQTVDASDFNTVKSILTSSAKELELAAEGIFSHREFIDKYVLDQRIQGSV